MGTLHQYKTIYDKSTCFDSHIITSVDDLIKLCNTKDVVFRGVNNAYYSMYSSFQRFYDTDSLKRLTTKECRKQALMGLVSKIHMDLEKHDIVMPLSDYNILALMQHYRLPSPLMDFTTSFEIALSFAFTRGNGKSELADYVSIYTLPSNDTNLICSLPNQAIRNSDFLNTEISKLDDFTRNRLETDTKIITADNYDEINDYRLIEGGLTDIRLEWLNMNVLAGNGNPNRAIQSGLFLQTPLSTSPVEECFYKKYNYKITSYEIPSSLEADIKDKFKLLTEKDLYSASNESKEISNLLRKYFRSLLSTKNGL